VDQKQIEIVDAPIGELLLGEHRYVLFGVECIPKLQKVTRQLVSKIRMWKGTHLGRNKQVLTLHETILDRARNTLAGLLLISIIARAVQKPVPALDRIVHGLDDNGSGASMSPKSKDKWVSFLHQRSSTW
jgi:hypothetical protein